MSVVPRAPTLCGRVARVATALPARSIRVRVFVCYKGFAASADSSVTTDLLHLQEHSCHVRLGRCHRRPLVREMANRMRLLRRVCWPLCKLVISLVFTIWSVVILPALCRYSVKCVRCDLSQTLLFSVPGQRTNDLLAHMVISRVARACYVYLHSHHHISDPIDSGKRRRVQEEQNGGRIQRLF